MGNKKLIRRVPKYSLQRIVDGLSKLPQSNKVVNVTGADEAVGVLQREERHPGTA